MCATCGRRVEKRRKYCGRRCMARGQAALTPEELIGLLNGGATWEAIERTRHVSHAAIARAVRRWGLVRVDGGAHRHGHYLMVHPRRPRQLRFL